MKNNQSTDFAELDSVLQPKIPIGPKISKPNKNLSKIQNDPSFLEFYDFVMSDYKSRNTLSPEDLVIERSRIYEFIQKNPRLKINDQKLELYLKLLESQGIIISYTPEIYEIEQPEYKEILAIDAYEQ